jgi:hypothetical protein
VPETCKGFAVYQQIAVYEQTASLQLLVLSFWSLAVWFGVARSEICCKQEVAASRFAPAQTLYLRGLFCRMYLPNATSDAFGPPACVASGLCL